MNALTQIALHGPDPLLELGDDLLAVPQRLLLHLLEATGQFEALENVAAERNSFSYCRPQSVAFSFQCASAFFFTHPQGPPCANFKCNTSFVFVGKKMKFNGELLGDFKVQFHLGSPTRQNFSAAGGARIVSSSLLPI